MVPLNHLMGSYTSNAAGAWNPSYGDHNIFQSDHTFQWIPNGINPEPYQPYQPNPLQPYQAASPPTVIEIAVAEDELLTRIENGERVSHKTLLLLMIRQRRIERILSKALKDSNIQDK